MVMYSSYYIVCKYINPCESLGVTTAMIEYYHIVPVTPRQMQSYEQILGILIAEIFAITQYVCLCDTETNV